MRVWGTLHTSQVFDLGCIILLYYYLVVNKTISISRQPFVRISVYGDYVQQIDDDDTQELLLIDHHSDLLIFNRILYIMQCPICRYATTSKSTRSRRVFAQPSSFPNF